MKLPSFLVAFLDLITGKKPSPKVAAVLHTVADLITEAAPIVADIAQLVPNKTVTEVSTAYAKYGFPVAGLLNNPVSIGNAMLNLGTQLLLSRLGSPVAFNLAQSAVQLAVSIAKAEAGS